MPQYSVNVLLRVESKTDKQLQTALQDLFGQFVLGIRQPVVLSSFTIQEVPEELRGYGYGMMNPDPMWGRQVPAPAFSETVTPDPVPAEPLPKREVSPKESSEVKDDYYDGISSDPFDER
jgi:hypothetical protein